MICVNLRVRAPSHAQPAFFRAQDARGRSRLHIKRSIGKEKESKKRERENEGNLNHIATFGLS